MRDLGEHNGVRGVAEVGIEAWKGGFYYLNFVYNFRAHHSNLACQSSHAFGDKSGAYLTDLAPRFRILYHEFGIPSA